MPDITMCNNDGCRKRENCYRFTATPEPFYQSWGEFQPRWHFNSFVCDGYWPLTNESQKTQRTQKTHSKEAA